MLLKVQLPINSNKLKKTSYKIKPKVKDVKVKQTERSRERFQMRNGKLESSFGPLPQMLSLISSFQP